MFNVSVGPACADDIDEIRRLLDELNAFYGGDVKGPAQERVAQVRSALFARLQRRRW